MCDHHSFKPFWFLDVSSSHFVQFQVWDLPGDIDFEDPNTDTDSIFRDSGAIIYVIDASYNYQESLSKLIGMISKAYSSYPKIEFSVFVHKVEDHSDEQKIDIQRDIQQQILEELMDRKLENVHLSFFLTSIYDRSIFEAFSKVIQSLIPQLPTLENLLDIFISNCRMEKAFLIDVTSKIYVATDPSPVDMPTLELCSDMIDVVIDVSSIYGQRDDPETFVNSQEYEPETRSVIKLNNDIVLYLREVDKNLALVCLLRQDKFDKHGLIDYNFRCFKNAVLKVIELSKKGNESVKNI